MAKQSTAVTTVASDKQLEKVSSVYKSEEAAVRIYFPRLGMYSKDKTEQVINSRTKKKELKIIGESGEFFIQRETEETDGEGKKIWETVDLGKKINLHIIYKRYQLRKYDEKTELYTSSPIFDFDDEEIPLFCEKKEVDRGLPKDLIEKDSYKDPETGKTRSLLEEQRVMYVIYEGEVYQMNLRGSSMWALKAFERANGNPTQFLTTITPEHKKRGSNEWDCMKFEVSRKVTSAEAELIEEKQKELMEKIAEQKAGFADADTAEGTGKDDW